MWPYLWCRAYFSKALQLILEQLFFECTGKFRVSSILEFQDQCFGFWQSKVYSSKTSRSTVVLRVSAKCDHICESFLLQSTATNFGATFFLEFLEIIQMWSCNVFVWFFGRSLDDFMDNYFGSFFGCFCHFKKLIFRIELAFVLLTK